MPRRNAKRPSNNARRAAARVCGTWTRSPGVGGTSDGWCEVRVREPTEKRRSAERKLTSTLLHGRQGFLAGQGLRQTAVHVCCFTRKFSPFRPISRLQEAQALASPVGGGEAGEEPPPSSLTKRPGGVCEGSLAPVTPRYPVRLSQL